MEIVFLILKIFAAIGILIIGITGITTGVTYVVTKMIQYLDKEDQ